jgi:nicotinamidase-related amidase
MAEPGRNPLVTRDESLLIIIDAQERLIPAVVNREKLIENMKRLVALSRILNIPTLFTEQEKLGPTLAEIRSEVTDWNPVSKLSFNCFLTDTFVERVRETRRTTLIISGVEAHICVAQTSLWAHPHFRVQVVSDAVSSRSPHNLDIALQRMRMEGITITSAEMVIYELLERAGTEEFKQMLPLVK